MYSKCQNLDSSVKVFDEVESKNAVCWNALIAGSVLNREIDRACRLFDEMPERNFVSWSVILRGLVAVGWFSTAIAMFNAMAKESGFWKSTVTIVIGACKELRDEGKSGKTLHGQIVKLGFDSDSDSEIAASFIRLYLKNNQIESAVHLYCAMTHPTVQICTDLVTALIQKAKIKEARHLYDGMFEKDVILSTAMVSGYMTEGMLEEAMDTFKAIPDPNIITYNVVLSGLLLQGKIEKARELFSEITVKNEVSYSAMISGLVRSGRNDEAFFSFKNMILNVKPNESAVASILSASGSVSSLGRGESIHGLAVRLGFEPRLITANALINMYGKCGEVEAARSVFDRMTSQDLISWNSMLHGYAVNGRGFECFKLYEKLKEEGIKPDDLTLLAMLSACVHNRLPEKSKGFFQEMRSEHGIDPRLPHYSCVIELLCKLGQTKEAKDLVNLMPLQPDPVIWSSLLSGCTRNLQADFAKIAADRLLEINPRDPTPDLSLTRIYAEAGKSSDLSKNTSDGRKIRRPGCSWIEINGKNISFFAGDKDLLSGDMAAYLESLLSISRQTHLGREKGISESDFFSDIVENIERLDG